MTQNDSILPLTFDRVSYSARGKDLLREVSFELDSGSRTVILGPNGAGKSLTLRLAHGLLAPTAGEVVWARPQVVASPYQAMVFERPVLLRRTVAANVEYPLRTRRIATPRRAARVNEALERTGLSHLADRRARVLSAGERQRLAIARAWATDPHILFLDEPTAALDPAAATAIESLIHAISADRRKIVMTTHDLGQARRLADDVLFFYAGQLLEHTRAETFFDNPASKEARAFVNGELTW